MLALTGILLDNCHRGTQSSCNLTVEVSQKHLLAHAQHHAHTRNTQREKDKHVQTCIGTPTQHTLMCTCKAYKHLYRSSYTHQGTDVHSHMHSISLNDMRWTHIDCLIFVGVCSSVKAPLTCTSTYSTLSTLYTTSPRQTSQYQASVFSCTLKQSAPSPFVTGKIN